MQRYPIKIQLALRKRQKETPDYLEKITAAYLQRSGSERKQYEFGAEVSVQDCGIIISEDDLCAISKVGTSQEHRLGTIEKMPLWLRPTGKFGIGLQSLFQADTIFWCTTRTHENECYKMIFHSGTRNEGYINVIPKNRRDGERSANLIQSFKMMKQMEFYLDRETGENIFPIGLEDEPLDISLVQEGWNEWIMPQQIQPPQRLKCVPSGGPMKAAASDHSGTTCWLFRQFTEQPANQFLCGQLTAARITLMWITASSIFGASAPSASLPVASRGLFRRLHQMKAGNANRKIQRSTARKFGSF